MKINLNIVNDVNDKHGKFDEIIYIVGYTIEKSFAKIL
jgi:hypothetical protein